MGEWHETLDDIEPGARPNRRPELPPGSPSRNRRKQAVARRSRERLAPGGNYFYWCEHCNYCNTPEEGAAARCPDHRKAEAASRKARWRDQAAGGTTGRIEPHEFTVPAVQLLLLWQRAAALDAARKEYEIALHRGTGPKAKRPLDQAIHGLLSAVAGLPKPVPRRRTNTVEATPRALPHPPHRRPE